MSRQRIRTGVLEGSTVVCAHCQGAGVVRSTASIALHVLRVLEDALIKSATHDVVVRTRTAVALYILNQKRANLRDLERRFGVAVTIEADDTLTGANYHAIERGEPATGRAARSSRRRWRRTISPRSSTSRRRSRSDEEETEASVEDEAEEAEDWAVDARRLRKRPGGRRAKAVAVGGDGGVGAAAIGLSARASPRTRRSRPTTASPSSPRSAAISRRRSRKPDPSRVAAPR